MPPACGVGHISLLERATGREGCPLVYGPACLEVALQRGLLEVVALVGADVEHQLVAVQKVIHLVHQHQHVLAVRPHLRAHSSNSSSSGYNGHDSSSSSSGYNGHESCFESRTRTWGFKKTGRVKTIEKTSKMAYLCQIETPI